MEDHERTNGEERAEQLFDRRRGPRRNADGSIPTDDRRRVDRRNTPGFNALIDDVLNLRGEIEPAD